MDIYTLDHTFKRIHLIENFESAIWTERYAGDGDVKITTPATTEAINSMPRGYMLSLAGSKEPMVIETHTIDNGILEVDGISLLKWMNNRFIRSSPYPADKEWVVDGVQPGEILCDIVQNWLIDSVYLTNYTHTPGTSPPADSMGIPYAAMFKIPNLSIIGTATADAYGSSFGTISVSVPFGPVYDALVPIANTYQIGMALTLESVSSSSFSLGFKSYTGLDRTSDQTVRPLVQFSPDRGNLYNIKELSSLADQESLVIGFAPEVDPAVSTYYDAPDSGFATTGSQFNLRAKMLIVDDVKDDMLGAPFGSPEAGYQSLVASKCRVERLNHQEVQLVDGEFVPRDTIFLYGTHYKLGDIVEFEGYSGITSKAMVTEYIRSKDASGEKSYPTVSTVE